MSQFAIDYKDKSVDWSSPGVEESNDCDYKLA
jgi:hypothetical protein